MFRGGGALASARSVKLIFQLPIPEHYCASCRWRTPCSPLYLPLCISNSTVSTRQVVQTPFRFSILDLADYSLLEPLMYCRLSVRKCK